ncbi:MAG: response regulator [Nanoarchaeota archaeon]|nr:response regulator [Nanoarchaeota archaeon]
MKKILYVEDHIDTAEAVKQMLEDEGYYVEISSRGGDGLKKAHENKFDIILLDVMLPDMSGWDIFKTLNTEKYNAKYVFLSVIPVSTERMKEFRKAGVSDYITKPFSKADLVERIKKVLG